MEIKTIKYEKLFSLGNYENEKIGIEIALGPGDEPVSVHMEAVKYVEHAHRFQKEYPTYQRAKAIAADPINHTGRQVEQAAQMIRSFEETFTRFLSVSGESLLPMPATDTEEVEVEDDNHDF